MYGLAFELAPQADPRAAIRADVACMVGHVARSAHAVPEGIGRWLVAHGYVRGGGDGAPHASEAARLAALLDLPVPIDSWAVFDRLFDWRGRALAGSEELADSALGSCVRSFFAHGGRKCYVVRVGDPEPLGAVPEAPAARADWAATHLARLLPGYPGALDANASERAGWRGIAHLMGVGEPALLLLPDLPELCAAAAPRTAAPEAATGAAQFVPCAADLAAPPPAGLRWLPAPRCDDAGYALWARAVSMVARFLGARRRDCQLLAALPLPHADSVAARDPLAALVREPLAPDTVAPLADAGDEAGFGRGRLNGASAFVQLAYPWLAAADDVRLPQGLLAPDGVLAGLVANIALTRGAARSAAGQSAQRVVGVFPPLPARALEVPRAQREALLSAWPLRLSLFAPGPFGVRLISDVTASAAPEHRAAAVGRLIGLVLRHARAVGEAHAFDSSGEALWSRVRAALEERLGALWRAGALGGASPAQAFEVRCDRSTMSQNDLDAGRLVCRVALLPQAAVERIVVQLALSEDAGAQVTALPDALVA